jgi:hypothetical protein
MQRSLRSFFAVTAMLTGTLALNTPQNGMPTNFQEGRQRNEQAIEQLLAQSGWLPVATQATAPAPQQLARK